MKKIQGGSFSKRGHLFLLAQEGTYGSGVYAFNMKTGRLSVYLYAELHPGFGRWEELEGITIWDLDSIDETDGMRGQIHAGLIDVDKPDVDPNPDMELYMKHWRVEFPENL